MGSLEISHDILIAGSDFESCQLRVKQFFDRTMLIRYDEALVMKNDSVNGIEENFLVRIQEGLAANQKVLEEFLENLKAEGFTTLDDLKSLEKGYVSKILHTIAHLQDGFIGIDSRFYNFEEDSHGVSRDTQKKISTTPENYWIIRVKGKIASMSEDPFDALRTFEGRGKNTD
ncbi:MAG: hypothetical protein JSW69_05395 [Deltaproteobacteria bacterium]|jgi:hypothetical protein|nr:MAG: hypothetical protein JSW69_05395 [Deltaproteobacteria bacterium]